MNELSLMVIAAMHFAHQHSNRVVAFEKGY